MSSLRYYIDLVENAAWTFGPGQKARMPDADKAEMQTCMAHIANTRRQPDWKTVHCYDTLRQLAKKNKGTDEELDILNFLDRHPARGAAR